MPDPRMGMSLSDFLPAAGRAILGGVSDVASAPRRAIWDVGPSLVGRSGQGPQTGADLLGRLGMNPNSGLIHALGIGAEMAGDPLMLSGLGGRAAASATTPGAANLTRRLEQFAGPGLQDASQAASGRLGASAVANGGYASPFASPWGAEVLSRGRIADPGRVPIAIPRPRGDAALPATIPGGGAVPNPIPGIANRVIRPETPTGIRGSVPGFGIDADAMRSIQLNAPNFNPSNPAFGLGTSQFTQDASTAARQGLESAPGLMTARFLQPAAEAATTTSPTSQSLLNRLQRMAPPAPRADY